MLPSDLTKQVEERRVRALSELDATRQVKLGQFFTPRRAATLIAGMPRLPRTGRLRVLDPGAGIGTLSAAVVARVIEEAPLLELELVAVEIDPQLAVYLGATLDDCAATAAENGVKVKAISINDDLVRMLAGQFAADEAIIPDSFDLVVMNPPYRKLAANSAERQALSNIGVECPNIYAAFLALGVIALRSGGQISAITPRSFANGTYFTQFRRFLLDRVGIDHIHAFESRSTIFADTGVLQENVILAGTRGKQSPVVALSLSVGHTDHAHQRIVERGEVVHDDDPSSFIRIPSAEDDTNAVDIVSRQPCTLSDLGLNASTGKVVDFRARDYLKAIPGMGTVPLIYPGNLRTGAVQWPREIPKSQAFLPSDEFSKKQLIPSGCYVLVKRFSAKEERRRVVAAVWNPSDNGSQAIAVENHLNVIHDSGSGIDRDLAVGLSLYLNSSVLDRYFRTFSGHTQVNATDLRSLRFPDSALLRTLGKGQPAALPTQEKIDELIETSVVLGKV